MLFMKDVSIFIFTDSKPQLMKRILKWIMVLVGIIILAVAGLLSYVKLALPDVGEPEELKIEYTEERIARGKYLANSVMVCMDCHSKRDFTKFGAPLVPGTLGSGGELFGTDMGFPGNFYAPNITPHHLKDWSDGELFRAITAGVSKDGRALFSIMPYPGFGQLDKEDIYSVIAYIRTLDPIQHDAPPSSADFPMNFIINTLPQPPSFTLKPEAKEQIAYGKYLVTSASCSDCHTPMEKGERLPGMYLAGGFRFPFPDKTTAVSANITPDLETGIGKWTEEEFVSRFKKYADSTFVPQPVKAGEFKTIMPWLFYSTMKEEDLKAIYAYLRTVPPVAHKVTVFEKDETTQESTSMK